MARLERGEEESLSLDSLCGFNVVTSRLEAIVRGDSLASFPMTMMGQSNRKVLIGMLLSTFLVLRKSNSSYFNSALSPKLLKPILSGSKGHSSDSAMNITDVAAQVLRQRQLAVMTGLRSWGLQSRFTISMDKDKDGRQRQILVFKYVLTFLG